MLPHDSVRIQSANSRCLGMSLQNFFPCTFQPAFLSHHPHTGKPLVPSTPALIDRNAHKAVQAGGREVALINRESLDHFFTLWQAESSLLHYPLLSPHRPPKKRTLHFQHCLASLLTNIHLVVMSSICYY